MLTGSILAPVPNRGMAIRSFFGSLSQHSAKSPTFLVLSKYSAPSEPSSPSQGCKPAAVYLEGQHCNYAAYFVRTGP
jgi:hypothetical protein